MAPILQEYQKRLNILQGHKFDWSIKPEHKGGAQ